MQASEKCRCSICRRVQVQPNMRIPPLQTQATTQMLQQATPAGIQTCCCYPLLSSVCGINQHFCATNYLCTA